jgi:serine/threonine-protein kinase
MSSPKPPAPEPSEIAGRYQVVQRLGAGAFGTVYKAKDKILGRMVAIKTIRLEGLAAASTDLQELTDRFKREAQVSAQLKHPNIVTIYDIGEADGASYLAMEFIDGVGLDKIIAGGPLPAERAALIGAQVADALDFAHRASVVHRDIKPANIMIEAGDRVKVTDFGIAKVTNSGEHLTMTGSLLGTPSYMSPEQARGGGIDGRSDLFAVGCVLYEMLAGKKAFRGDSITALIFKIITEDPPPLRAEIAELPDAMERVVAKALAKTPETRYQTGRELAEELLALTRAGSTPTLRQSETPTSPGLVGAPPPIVAPGKSAPPTVVSSPTARAAVPSPETAQPTRVSRPAAPPLPAPKPAPRKHSSAGLLLGLAAMGMVALAVAGAGAWYLFSSHTAKVADDSVPSPGPPVPSPEAPVVRVPTPEASSPPAAPPDSAPPAADARVAAPAPPRTASSGTRAPATLVPAPAARPPESEPAPDQPPQGQDFSFLDREPPPVDGVEAGRRLSESFRNGQPHSGSFGATQRYAQREKSPRDLTRGEFPAVATLRHVMNCEEAFYRKHGRYGTLLDLKGDGLLRLDVAIQPRQFLRQSYAFDLDLEGDGFRVSAAPKGGGMRPFVGDDSGFIRVDAE